jgi:hypothetical protein
VATLDIPAKGRPARCAILTSTGTDAGDMAVCRHLMTTEFSPATDAGGRAVPLSGYEIGLDIVTW